MLLVGGVMMWLDASSESGVRNPDTPAYALWIMGAGRVSWSVLAFWIALLALNPRSPLRFGMLVFGAGLGLMALIEPPLFRSPYSWPSMAGPVLGMIVAWRAIMLTERRNQARHPSG